MQVNVYLPIPVKERFTYHVGDDVNISLGYRVLVPFGKREVVGYVASTSNDEEKEYKVKDIIKVVDKTPSFNQALLDLAIWMSKIYITSPGLVLSCAIPSGKRESSITSFSSSAEFTLIKKLSSEQEAAIEAIKDNKGPFYLYGITGSGKSEVYLRSAESVIKEGKKVIYLVPEITLTHQIIEDIQERFNNRVALLHSGLTPSQRLKYWYKIINNEVDIVIGARSAVFAPFKSLGLIIIDEEHESSYKSGNTPRYHARQVAQRRCQIEGAKLIMGSATPSLEAYKEMESGSLMRLDLKTKVAGGKNPLVQVVNMLGQSGTISKTLESEIREHLSKKLGVILFLNRRGYTYYYHCNSCGHVEECPDCSVALTYHKKENRMVCHYCGYTSSLVDKCSSCGSFDMSVSGIGCEKVEEEVKKLFPYARVARLDTDVASKDKDKVKEIIDEFKEGKIDILLGTQMVAKGLNFPSLSLVGVVLADSTLSIPDFRSEERTFSLLEQVKGRSGRYRDDGRVIIQTYRVDDSAINAVVSGDIEGFYKSELEIRKALDFPPYKRLLSLVLRSKNEEKVKECAKELSAFIISVIEQSKLKDVNIVGVNPCIIYKKAQAYRYQILLSSSSFIHLNRVTTYALENYKAPSSIYIEVDVDPLSLM